MRHRLAVCLGLLLLAAAWLVPVTAQEVSLTGQVIERTLPNGLKVLMVKRPEAPLITASWPTGSGRSTSRRASPASRTSTST